MPTPRIGAKSALLALAIVTAPSCQTKPRWYKGNLHTHSLWSDGNDVPEMICDWYQRNGYQFVALSDHNILSNVEKWMDVNTIIKRGGRKWLGRYKQRFGDDWVTMRTNDKGKAQVRLKRLDEFRPLLEKPGEFLLIQAEEVTSAFKRFNVHINVTNIKELIPKQTGDSVPDVMRKVLKLVKEQGKTTGQAMFAHLNHPNFGYSITAEELAAVIEERFFEVWNGHPSVGHRGDQHRAGVERLWDIANTLRIAKLKAPPLFGLGTDDSHNYFNEDPRTSITGRGWVMVRAQELSAEALVQAMQAGDFYASSGVVLKTMECSETAIDLEIEPAGDEEFTTRFIGTMEGYNDHCEVVKDSKGKEVHATLRYSDEVGQVLATVKGLHPRYKLTGKELYVRAEITSTGKPTRAVYQDQLKKAWTQPVGWRKRGQ